MKLMLNFFNLLPSSWIQAGANLRGKSPFVKRLTDWIPNMLRNRDGKIANGLGKGLRFNGGKSAVGFLLGTHDTDVQFAFSKLVSPGEVFYDMGANVGFTGVLAAKLVGPKGKVLCFEPMPENARQIQINADLNQFDWIKVFQVALGGEDGEAEFTTSNAPTWGRLSEVGATPSRSGVTKVPVKQLDSMVVRESLPLPQFIKMDVEGAEASVLNGARQTLEKSKPVMVIELHHTYKPVAEILTEMGYVIRPLVPGGKLASFDGEFQILVYQPGNKVCENFWNDILAGKKLAFD